MENRIFSIENNCEEKLKEKGSVFIAKAFRINSVDEAEKVLDEIRKKYYDATHHCFAYKVFEAGERFSDDGEPNGTAGVRILNAVNRFELTNVLVVVVRYFGGTKLGVGPLGKAYYESAFNVLSACKRIEYFEYIKIEIKIDFNQSSSVYGILSRSGAKKIETIYDNAPIIYAFVKLEEAGKVKKKIIDATKNKASVKLGEEKFLLKK